MPEINEDAGDYVLDTTSMLKALTRLFPQMAWTSDWLHANVRNKPDKKMTLQSYFIEYKGQPDGYRTQHKWRIYTDDPMGKIRLAQAVQYQSTGLIPIQQTQYQSSQSSNEPFAWNGLQLRSLAEQKIAEELEKRKILFFVNARCRITTRIGITETKEADFLIYYKGNSRILEVDGQEYHQSAAKDHQRDRLFERHGIRCTRFTANECLNNPDHVIDEFLELFDVTQVPSKNYGNGNNKTEESTQETITTIDIDTNKKTSPPRPQKKLSSLPPAPKKILK